MKLLNEQQGCVYSLSISHDTWPVQVNSEVCMKTQTHHHQALHGTRRGPEERTATSVFARNRNQAQLQKSFNTRQLLSKRRL